MIRIATHLRRAAYAFSSEEANFGFKKVALNEKQLHVDQVFHSVAQKYLFPSTPATTS